MAHDTCCIGAEQVILHGRAMRSDDNEIGLGFLGDSQNLCIDAGTIVTRMLGFRSEAPTRRIKTAIRFSRSDVMTS